MGKVFTIWLLAAALIPAALGAEENNEAEEEGEEEAEAPGVGETFTEQDIRALLKEELAAQALKFNQQLDLQKKEIEQLRFALEGGDAFGQDDFNAEEFSLEGEFDDKERFFRIFGFFDVTLKRYFIKDNDSANLFVQKDLSFIVSNLNLYFQSQKECLIL